MHDPNSPTAIRQRSPNRSGQSFAGVVRIVGFFCLVALSLVLVHQMISAGLRRIKTSAFGVSNKVMNGQVNAEILISGSSRALTHFDPRIIHEKTGRTAFNIGRNGSQTDMQLAYLKAYLDHNAKPSLIIHSLDLYSFVTTREVYDPVQYLPYLRESPIYQALAKINPDQWKSRLLPLYGYAVDDMRFTWLLGIKGVFGWNPNEDHFDGFKPRYSSWTGDFEHFKKVNPDGVRFEIEPEGVRVMHELADLCQERGIRLLLVYSPVYREMQAFEKNRTEIFAEFEVIRQRYGVTLWDYSDSLICQNQDYFYNSQHLNADGAAVFTIEIADKVASLSGFGQPSKVAVGVAK